MPERCANCDGVIGNLETPWVWHNSVVCEACYQKLTQQAYSPVISSVGAPRMSLQPGSSAAVLSYASPAISEVASQTAAASAQETTLWTGKPVMFGDRPVEFILSMALILVFGLGLVILLFWWLACLNQTLTITSKRAILKRGIISKFTTEVRHEDVRNIQMGQHILQRMFDVGSIAISTAARNEWEVEIRGIKSPERVRQMISKLRDHAQAR